MKITFAVAALLSLVALSHAQCDITIAEGASWETDFQAALNTVNDSQVICFVGDGSYTGASCDFSSFGVNYDIDFQGSTIDCDGVSQFLSITTGNVTLTGGTISNTDNTFSAVGCNEWLYLEAMTFDNCVSATSGGAVDANNVVATNCVFTNNDATLAGALYIDTFGNVTDCTFTNNDGGFGAAAADSSGAEAYFYGCSFSSNPGGALQYPTEVHDCSFTDNSADNGAAIYTTVGVTVTGSTFTTNTGTSYGTAIYGYYDVSIDSSTFTGNTGALFGGAVSADGFSITNSYFSGNEAQFGGAACCLYGDGPVSISGTTFANNEVTDAGSALYISGSDITVSIDNCTVTDNTAPAAGILNSQVFISSVDSVSLTDTTITGDESPMSFYVNGATGTTVVTDVEILSGGTCLHFTDVDATISGLSIRECSSDISAVYFMDSTVDSSDTCIAENYGKSDGGVFAFSVTWEMNGSTDVRGNRDKDGNSNINEYSGTNLNNAKSSEVCGFVPITTTLGDVDSSAKSVSPVWSVVAVAAVYVAASM